MRKEDLRIVFMGTPEFAVESLKALVEHQYRVEAVITAPDKPAGRGQSVQMSAVKKFALAHQLPLLQPEKLKDPEFIKTLSEIKPDVQIVVAFRMLPEIVWSLPRHGTFNLHASLLPDFRGAAPIHWAIINGETETGVTTFFLTHDIDAGEIILQKRVPIFETDSAGDLHDRLMYEGAELVLKTVDLIINEDHVPTFPQVMPKIIKNAPKIFTETCRINWSQQVVSVYNFIRGLSPYPGAWTELHDAKSMRYSLKIYETTKEYSAHNFPAGYILTDQKKMMRIAVSDGFIHIKQLQLAGKKRLPIEDFLRGFLIDDDFYMQ
ncbi:MAG: methionyl-tRNA formyltransferase [Microbacter sp.]